MTPIYAVYGASGCGRGIMPIARMQSDCEYAYIDDSNGPDAVNGHSVYRFEAFCELSHNDKFVVVAVADPVVRKALVAKCASAGLQFFDVRSAQSTVFDDVSWGEGALISPYVTFTSNVRIGRHFHANINSYVEHDCRIGDFVTFAPGVQCNGNVHIGNGAYVGAGAIIKQGTPAQPLIIGADAVIGMGAVVLENVAVGSTVVGNPARPIIRST